MPSHVIAGHLLLIPTLRSQDIPRVTGHFGPIPVRTTGCFSPIPFRSGHFGPILVVGPFGPVLAGGFSPLFCIVFLVIRTFSG